jgi:hypothetical protein
MIWLGRPSHGFPSARGSSLSTCPHRSCDFPSEPHGSSSSTCRRRSRRSVLCAPACNAGTTPARTACPLPVLAPPVEAALHPPVAATAEVHTGDELRTGDLRALRGIELCAGVELHNDELHSSKQQGDITLALKSHVASICFKCFICLNGCTRMLQISIPNVSFVFSDVCCKCVYLDTAYALHL